LWLCPWFQSVQDSSIAEAIRNAPVLLPAIEIVHLLGLTLLGGTVLMIDLDLLGIAMRRQPASSLAQQLAPWSMTGLVMLFITGPPLLVAEAMKMYMNPIFPIKMAILTLGVVFHFTIFRTATSGRSVITPIRAKLVGAVSLLLWGGTGFAAKVMEIF
jgi:hypothetical protein